MNMNLNTPRSLPATVTTSHFSGFAGRDVSNKMVQSFAMFVFFSWTPKLRGKHTCPLTNNFYTLKCHKCTSVTSVLKTDCRKKGDLALNLWCDNKLNEKSQHWKRRRELSKDATLNASRLHSWMDSCQCSNLSLQRIYDMFWTLEDDGWNNESVVLVMRSASPTFR